MRLSLSLNGSSKYTASQPGPGFLSAHVNLHNRPKDDDHSGRVRIAGTITEETETTRLDWRSYDLTVGDVVELRVLPDGPGDPPVETQKSSEAPTNLLSNVDFAKEVLATVSEIDGRLMKLLEKAEKVEPSDEYKKFGREVGNVIYELGEHLLYPIFRRHKELIPADMKGELL